MSASRHRIFGFAPVAFLLCLALSSVLSAQQPSPAVEKPPAETPAAVDPQAPAEPEVNPEEIEIQEAAVAKPVSAEPVQLFGWRENIHINDLKEPFIAKLDTGARTSSIHAEKKEMFERDGKKWMRFILTDPTNDNSVKVRVEAPLVRIVHIKEPGGVSIPREVVVLNLKIGERKLKGEFTLNDRSNMLAPVLVGRSMLKELGWVDPGRTHLAEKKIFR